MPKIQTTKNGKWKKTQNDKFMKALIKYGKNWNLIQKYVGSRTLAQVRSHSQKLFLSMNKFERATFQEELKTRFDNFCEHSKIKAQSNKRLDQHKTTPSPMPNSKLQDQQDNQAFNFYEHIENDIGIYQNQKQKQYTLQNNPEQEAKQFVKSETNMGQNKEKQKLKIQQNFPSIDNTPKIEFIQNYSIPIIPMFYWYTY